MLNNPYAKGRPDRTPTRGRSGRLFGRDQSLAGSKESKTTAWVQIQLVYIVEGQRILGYDNAHGRDHRHVREKGYPYTFRSPGALVEDFLRDLADVQQEGQV